MHWHRCRAVICDGVAVGRGGAQACGSASGHSCSMADRAVPAVRWHPALLSPVPGHGHAAMAAALAHGRSGVPDASRVA